MELLEGETLDGASAARPLRLGDAAGRRRSRLRTRSTRRMPRASCTATSSPPTSSSRRAVRRRSWTSVSPKLGDERQSDKLDRAAPTDRELMHDRQGTAVGTIAYMSPEQARGEESTSGATVLFGVVLYEMATGQRAFQGNTTAVVFDAILNREPPPPTALNANISVDLQHVIARLIEKDRTLRYQSAAEVRGELERIRRQWESESSALKSGALPLASASGSRWDRSAPAVPVAAARTSFTPSVVIGTAAGLVLVIGLASWIALGNRRPEEPQAPPVIAKADDVALPPEAPPPPPPAVAEERPLAPSPPPAAGPKPVGTSLTGSAPATAKAPIRPASTASTPATPSAESPAPPVSDAGVDEAALNEGHLLGSEGHRLTHCTSFSHCPPPVVVPSPVAVVPPRHPVVRGIRR